MKGISEPPKRNYSSHSLGFSVIKSFLAIVVLSAFVLGVVFVVEKISKFDSNSLSKLLSKAGISDPRIGQVAGDVISRISETEIVSNHELLPQDGGNNVIDNNIISTATQKEKNSNPKTSVLSIAIASDLHFSAEDKEFNPNIDHLKTLLNIISEKGISDLVFLGDSTNFGEYSSLKAVSDVVRDSKINYYFLPGDRDQAASVNLDNFLKTFGRHNYVFELGDYKFVAFDNSANFTPVSSDIMDWFKNEVRTADFVFLSQPVYTEGLSWPFNLIYMGSSWETQEDSQLKAKQLQVKTQRDEILDLIRESNVKAVISGDHHKSSKVVDSEKSSLEHYVIGALGGNVKEYSQKTLQSERFSILNFYTDGSFELEDVLLAN